MFTTALHHLFFEQHSVSLWEERTQFVAALKVNFNLILTLTGLCCFILWFIMNRRLFRLQIAFSDCCTYTLKNDAG